MSSPMARGSLEISPITSTNVPRRWPTLLHPLHNGSQGLSRFARQGITPLVAEHERGATLIADACVHMMHVAI